MSTVVYFLVWGAIIFLMMRFGCGAHIMGHGHQHDGIKTDGQPLTGDARWVPPSKAIDPVCGMTVDPAGSKSTIHDGHVFCFCSQECREKFEASPAAYTGSGASRLQNMELTDEHRH